MRPPAAARTRAPPGRYEQEGESDHAQRDLRNGMPMQPETEEVTWAHA